MTWGKREQYKKKSTCHLQNCETPRLLMLLLVILLQLMYLRILALLVKAAAVYAVAAEVLVAFAFDAPAVVRR